MCTGLCTGLHMCRLLQNLHSIFCSVRLLAHVSCIVHNSATLRTGLLCLLPAVGRRSVVACHNRSLSQLTGHLPIKGFYDARHTQRPSRLHASPSTPALPTMILLLLRCFPQLLAQCSPTRVSILPSPHHTTAMRYLCIRYKQY